MAEHTFDILTDIQRYLQQQMSPEEMHAFEKALLSDPLMSDALDGFTEADSTLSGKHLELIRTEIKEKSAEHNSVKPFVYKYNWLRIAAIILIMATGSIVLFSVRHQKSNADKNSSEIAANKIINPPAKDDSIKENKSFAADVIKPENNLFPKKPNASPLILKDNNAPLASLSKNDLGRLKTEKANTSTSLEMAAAPQNSNDNRDIASMSDVPRESTPAGVFNKAFSDSAGEIVADGSMKNMNKDIAGMGYLKSKAENKRIYKTADSTEIAKIEVVRQTTTSARDMSIVRSDEKENRSIVGYTVTSSKKPMNAPKPLNTEENYKQYVKKQVDSILKADGRKPQNISVIIEFFVDETGQPVNIKVLNTTDKYYTEKAYYVIKNGPLWQPGNNKDIQRITVSF